MPEASAKRTSFVGIAPDTQARVIALVGTTSLYTLALQCGRMMVDPDELWRDPLVVGWLDIAGFLGSTALLEAGLALFAFGFLLLQKTRRVRSLATSLLQVLALLLLVVQTAAQVYFYETEQTLDWPMFSDALSRPAELVTLGAGAVPFQVWIGLATCTAIVGAAPWLAGARARKRKADPAVIARARPAAIALLFIGPAVAALGFLPTTPLANDTSAPRDPVLNLLATIFPSRAVPNKAFGDTGPRDYFRVEIEPVPPAPGQPKRRPRNIVVVILESTRASAVSVYNPLLATTPFLESLAKKSLVVERMQAVIPTTRKALRHILCGFEGSHSIRPQALTLGVMSHCLPNLLREQGYNTLFIQSAKSVFDHRVSSAFSMGFGDYLGPESFDHEGFEMPNFLGWDDEVMLQPSREWLKKHKDKPFMVTYLTVDAHYECKPVTRRPNLIFTGRPDFDCYLNAVRHDDFFVQELIRQYEDLGLAKDTVFAIVGDHGEAYGEHGRRVHNDVPWQEGLQIPALIYDPNGQNPAPGTAMGTWAQVDIAPTLTELAGFRVRAGQFTGISLLHPPPPNRIIHSFCLGEEACIASVQGTRKLIHHFRRKRDELFDLAHDPLELVNLADARDAEVEVRRAEVLDWDDQLKARYAWFELHRDAPLGDPEYRALTRRPAAAK